MLTLEEGDAAAAVNHEEQVILATYVTILNVENFFLIDVHLKFSEKVYDAVLRVLLLLGLRCIAPAAPTVDTNLRPCVAVIKIIHI